MIVKYLNDGVWGYIDNVRQVGNKEIDVEELIKQHDDEVSKGKRQDVCSFIDFTEEIPTVENERLPDDIIKVNKVFIMATEGLVEEIKEDGYHAENLLDSTLVENNCPANTILLYLNDHKEYETLVFITNQKTYLMNDKGQTIERLA